MLTEEQLLARERRIGSSDAPVILGVSPWGSPVDVWRRIMFGRQDTTPSARMSRGSALEPAIVNIAADEMGLSVAEYPAASVIGDGDRLPAWFTDHADAILSDGCPLEVKAYSWSDGSLSDYITTQCMWHLAAHRGAERCHVVIFVNVGAVYYRSVERDDAAIANIIERVGEWYEQYVVAGVEPPPTTSAILGPRSADVADAALVTVSDGRSLDDISAQYAEIRARIEALENEADALKRLAVAALSECGARKAVGMNGAWLLVEQKRVDWAAVARELNPPATLVERLTKVSRFPRFEKHR